MKCGDDKLRESQFVLFTFTLLKKMTFRKALSKILDTWEGRKYFRPHLVVDYYCSLKLDNTKSTQNYKRKYLTLSIILRPEIPQPERKKSNSEFNGEVKGEVSSQVEFRTPPTPNWFSGLVAQPHGSIVPPLSHKSLGGSIFLLRFSKRMTGERSLEFSRCRRRANLKTELVW